MKSGNLRFVSTQSIKGSSFSHVFEGKSLYIIDEGGETFCEIKGKEQLLKMCTALGIVGTGVRL